MSDVRRSYDLTTSEKAKGFACGSKINFQKRLTKYDYVLYL